ncbi:MAG: hypothetical protein H8E66_34960 [Planctomycetes bacterium]|nr:hypothetical protein [Planctomycetota bacterium]
MNQSAKVTSIDAVRALRSALIKFEENARNGVIGLELEIRRAVDWIDVDRRRYWPVQVKKASDGLAEARNALERCQLKYGSEEPPSCYEQKKNYELAKRRLRYCEEQVRKVKHWAQAIRRELTTFEGQMAEMKLCVDSEIPRAVAAIGKMLAALERYAGTDGNVSQETASVGLEEVSDTNDAKGTGS